MDLLEAFPRVALLPKPFIMNKLVTHIQASMRA